MIAVVLVAAFALGIERRIQNGILNTIHGTLTVRGDREKPIQAIVAVVSSESDRNAKFFQWGWNCDVGYRAQRLSASRLLATPIFSQVTKDSKEPFPSWLKDFDRDLTNAKPEFILVDLTTLPDGIMPAAGNASGLAILAAHLASDYKPRLT